MSNSELSRKLAYRLRWQQQAHVLERQISPIKLHLQSLRQWQSARLANNFAHFLQDAKKKPAAEFFLSDLYSDADFLQRDLEAAKILPKMTRLLPENLLHAAVDAIELSVLSHALDLRMTRCFARNFGSNAQWDEHTYQQIYQQVALPRLRIRQIDLVLSIGFRLDAVIKMHGVSRLLAASRLPARLLGLQQLQGFLERGFTAFHQLGGAKDFLNEIHTQEICIARRLMRGERAPFVPPFS